MIEGSGEEADEKVGGDKAVKEKKSEGSKTPIDNVEKE